MQQVYYENHRDSMESAYAWYAKDDHFTPHFHNSIELVYVLSGEVLATVDGTAYRVTSDTILVNSSYAVHSYETPKSSFSMIAIIPLAAVPSLRAILSKKAFITPLCPDDREETFRKLMEMLVRFTNEKSEVVLKGLSYAILGRLMDKVGLTDARESSRATFIRDVLEYLELHHAEPLSAELVAARFGYSRSRFSHIFNAQLGYALPDYLGALRCRHAARLLRETEMPVSDVALSVGFESLRTFYRVFKKQYEMTPNQYAKAGR